MDLDEGIKFAAGIDFSRVDSSDRNNVRSIVLGILQFEYPMPKVKIDVYPTPDHYNICIKGWNQELDFDKLYETFRSGKKDSLYDSIISVKLVPEDDEKVPLLKFAVRKSSFAKQKKKY